MNLALLMEKGRITTFEEIRKHLDSADITQIDSKGRTPLMIACENADEDVTELLLTRHANPNTTCDRNGYTALHFLCDGDKPKRVDRIAKLLVQHGATFQSDNRGLNPLFYAALSGSSEVVEYLVSLEYTVSKKDRIMALETLGTTFINPRWGNCSPYVYELFRRAMKLRHEDNDDTFPKTHSFHVEGGIEFTECKTMSELEKIKGDWHGLNIESFVILDRNLPDEMKRSHLFNLMTSYARCELTDESQWKESLNLFSYATSPQLKSKSFDDITLGLAVILLTSAVSAWDHINPFQQFSFHDVHMLLKSNAALFALLDLSKCDQYQFKPLNMTSVGCFLSLVSDFIILTTYLFPDDKEVDDVCLEVKEIMNTTRQVSTNESFTRWLIRTCRNEKRYYSSSTRLRLALPIIIERLICRMLQFEDATSLDIDTGDTLIQTLIKSIPVDDEMLSKVLPILVRYGCPLNKKNDKGESAMDWIRDQENDNILRELQSLQHCTLQELAARNVRKYRIPYRGSVAQHLYELIQIK